MKNRAGIEAKEGAAALVSRRRFLKKALLGAAYATPLILSYPSAVFASHCALAACGGPLHSWAGMTWTPGCSPLT